MISASYISPDQSHLFIVASMPAFVLGFLSFKFDGGVIYVYYVCVFFFAILMSVLKPK